MTCDDFKADVGAYVLGSLDEGERAAMESHLAEVREHQGCADALARARATVERLDSLPAPPPAPAVWRGISQQIGRVRGRERARSWLGWMVAIAAVVVMVIALRRRDAGRGELAAALTSSQQKLTELAAERDRCREELARVRRSAAGPRKVMALLRDPGARVVAMVPQPGKTGQATAILGGNSARAVVLSTGLRPVPGKALQLWVIRGQAPPAPAGFLRPQDQDWMEGEVAPETLHGGPPDAVAISLEPEGGRPSPSEILLVGTFRR